jgi:hypothetical protein
VSSTHPILSIFSAFPRVFYRYLLPSANPAPSITWTPTVTPAYGPNDTLPADAEAQALLQGVQVENREMRF